MTYANRSFRGLFALTLTLSCVLASAHAQGASTQPGALAPPLTAAVEGLTPQPVRAQLASFGEAKRMLVAGQPALQLQAAAVERARADVERALSQLLPRLDLSAGADYALVRRPFLQTDTRFFDSQSFVPNATAALAITFSLSRLAALDSAQLQLAAQTQGLAAVRHQLIGGLAAAMLGVLGAERVATRMSAGYAAAQERMRLTERLAQVGRITAVDALRFSQDLSDSQSELVAAIEALSQARDALGQALGAPEAIGVSDAFDAQLLLAPNESGCKPIASLSARADRQAAAMRVEGADAAASAARLAYAPELRLTSLYSARLAPALEITFLGAREVIHDWGARANLVWTLYDGGERSANVTRTDADAAALRAEQARIVIDSEQELRRSQRLVNVAKANLAAAQSSVQAAREIDRLSRKALELGTVTALETVDAARRLRAVEVTLALREVEELAARVRQRMTLAVCQ